MFRFKHKQYSLCVGDIGIKMIKRILLFCLLFFISHQVALAECKADIPGYYPDRFEDHNNGTITDRLTGLMWMKCDLDLNWDDVKKECADPPPVVGGGSGRIKKNWQQTLVDAQAKSIVGLAGLTDWRLPNIKELTSIMELNCISMTSNLAIDNKVFDVEGVVYWSSTPDRNTTPVETPPVTNQAWSVNYRYPINLGANRQSIDEELFARLVRGN